jgi:6-pyruvoyltetrahydropterin/6-carboxytetrahydropterin synthase
MPTDTPPARRETTGYTYTQPRAVPAMIRHIELFRLPFRLRSSRTPNAIIRQRPDPCLRHHAHYPPPRIRFRPPHPGPPEPVPPPARPSLRHRDHAARRDHPPSGSPVNGMVMDFSDIKTLAKQNLVDIWDHAFLVWRNDTVLLRFLESLPGTQDRGAGQSFPPPKTWRRPHSACSIACTGTATATTCGLNSVRLYETPNCWADALRGELGRADGGGGRIRTHDALADMADFKSAAFNRSATPPNRK